MDKWDSFPTGKDRKRIVKNYQARTEDFQKTGPEGLLDNYDWVDSPLDGPPTSWGVSFAESFRTILPEHEVKLKDYIEKVLEGKKGKAVGIEFGGSGLKLFQDFTPGFFSQSFGITLINHRSGSSNEYGPRDHKVLEKNIFSAETYTALSSKLKGEKVDLIIERMAGGLEFVPLEPYEVSKYLQIWYKLLNEGGIMFVQIPNVFNNLLLAWVAKIEKEYKDSIEIQYRLGYVDNSVNCSAFRLRKLSGAPKELPLLDSRTVRKIPKGIFSS